MDKFFEVIFYVFVIIFDKKVDRFSWKVSYNTNEIFSLVYLQIFMTVLNQR